MVAATIDIQAVDTNGDEILREPVKVGTLTISFRQTDEQMEFSTATTPKKSASGHSSTQPSWFTKIVHQDREIAHYA